MRDLIPFSDLPADSAPFSDVSFKLTVLSELIETRVLDFGDFEDFLKFIEGPQYDFERDGYEPSARALDYLARYPLTQAHLDSVKFLEFDGGLVVYEFIHPFWGGESDAFDIASLQDIRLLRNLERFAVTSMLTSTDLKPLRTARQLERVSLGLIGTWQNMDALLGLPRLERITVFKSNLKAKFRDPVLIALKEKGVAISIYR